KPQLKKPGSNSVSAEILFRHALHNVPRARGSGARSASPSRAFCARALRGYLRARRAARREIRGRGMPQIVETEVLELRCAHRILESVVNVDRALRIRPGKHEVSVQVPYLRMLPEQRYHLRHDRDRPAFLIRCFLQNDA